MKTEANPESLTVISMSSNNIVGSKEWMLPVEALNRFVPPEGYRNSLYADTDNEIIRYGYMVSGHGFLIGKGMKSEVVEDKEVFHLPKTGEMLVGLMNLRGNLIPVFSLSRALKIRHSKSSIVLILGENGDEVGVTIDKYPLPIHEIEAANELPTYPDNVLPFMSPGTSCKGLEWSEFDCHAFFKDCATKI